jgi:hypothetical protein
VNLVTALEPKEVTPPTSEGAAINYLLSSILGLPTNNWIITGWIYIDASDLSNNLLLALLESGPVTALDMQWPFNGAPYFSNGYWSSQNPGEYFREVKKWFHLNMGSVGGTGYGVVTLRGSITSIATTWEAFIPLTSTTSVIAPRIDSTFHVIAN